MPSVVGPRKTWRASVPCIVQLSHHKAWVFAIAGALIALSSVQRYAVSPRLRKHNAACLPGNSTACDSANQFSKVVLWIAVAIYGIGFFVAYVLGPILTRLDTGS